MSDTLRQVCRRLGRRPLNLSELTDDERRALAVDQAEGRAALSAPVERRIQ